jgi:hypothetical protein
MMAVGGFYDVIRQVDKQLGEATLRGGVVAEDRREGCISEGFRQALPKGLTGSGVVTQPSPKSC